ncbi:hypothetical protein H8959_018891 [Pygathrix nigripes]
MEGVLKEGSINHKEAVTIPKGCVLAFRVRQLMVKGKDEWDIPHICNDNMQTFPPGGKAVCPIIVPIGDVHKGFRTLKEEVQRETQQVERLSQAGQSSLLSSLSKLLGKKKELQDLELAVESTMEQNFLQDKEGVFPLHPELLSSLGEEELTLTEALVGLSGLEVQRSGPPIYVGPRHPPSPLCSLCWPLFPSAADQGLLICLLHLLHDSLMPSQPRGAVSLPPKGISEPSAEDI